jgi:PST family polysaccharide transporter
MAESQPRSGKSVLLRSVFTGLTFQYVGVLLQGILQVGVLALLARLLAPHDFGLVGLATAFVGLATVLSQFGLTSAIVQRPTLTERDVRAGFTLSVVLGLLSAALLAAAAPIIARGFKTPPLAGIIEALSLTFVIASAGFVGEALLQRNLAWGRLMWVNLGSYVFGYAATGITLALLHLGPWALVGSQLGQALVRAGILLFMQPFSKRPLFDGAEIRELFRYGRGFTFARLFNYGSQQGDNLVVGRFMGMAPLGFYTRAFKLMLLPVTYFAQIVTRVLFPIMARVQRQPEKLASAYFTGAAVMALVSAPLSVVMVVTAPDIVALVLGSRWMPSVLPFRILTLGIVMRNGYLMAYSLDGALGAMSRRAVRDGIFCAAVLIGSAAGVRYGLAGVATGVLCAMGVHYLVAARMSIGLLHSSWRNYARSQWPGLGMGLLAALVAVPARAGLRQLHLPHSVLLVGTVLLTTGAVLGSLLLWPRLLGEYGTGAARMLDHALEIHRPPRGLGWVHSVSRGMARRLAGQDQTTWRAA